MSVSLDRPSNSGSVKSVGKVLDILECLGAVRRPISVSEVARATGINVSTAHRLLQTLARRGYIEQRAETRNYALGPRLLELGSAYAGNLDVLRAALPHLEALRDLVHETIHLGILNEGDVVEICNAGGGQAVTVSLKAGRRDPAHCTATGKVLLAALPEADLDRFFERGRAVRATPKSLTSRARLMKEIERARANGYAIDDDELATSSAASACRSSAPRPRGRGLSASPCRRMRFRRRASPAGSSSWTRPAAASRARSARRMA